MDGSIHNHNAPPFMMSPGDKLFPPPGSFNFSMAALAADPQALASKFVKVSNAIYSSHRQLCFRPLFRLQFHAIGGC